MIIPSLNSLGFPDWPLDRLVEFARQNEVQYIELRGLENEMDLTVLPALSSPEAARSALAYLEAPPVVRILSLNTGFRLLDFIGGAPGIQAEHARRYAGLAARLKAPYMRVFAGGANGGPADLEKLARGASAFLELMAPYPVEMVLETHDCLMRTADILALNKALDGRLAILWDFANQINFSGENWRETWDNIGPLVRYLHAKDTLRQPDGSFKNVLLLEGDLPVREIVGFLRQQPEEIILSFEWEKGWDPGLIAGDIASRDYLDKLKRI